MTRLRRSGDLPSLVHFPEGVADGGEVGSEEGDFLPADAHEVQKFVVSLLRRHLGSERGVLPLSDAVYDGWQRGQKKRL